MDIDLIIRIAIIVLVIGLAGKRQTAARKAGRRTAAPDVSSGTETERNLRQPTHRNADDPDGQLGDNAGNTRKKKRVVPTAQPVDRNRIDPQASSQITDDRSQGSTLLPSPARISRSETASDETGFDLKKAIVYTEILKPKFEE